MYNIIKTLIYKVPQKLRWPLFIAMAVGSFGSFMSINSAWADANKINGLLWVSGIILGLATIAVALVAQFENYEE